MSKEKLKKKGINLVFEGSQKSILNLFKQYDHYD